MYHFLGLLEDIRHVITPLIPMRSYKLPEGTEVTRTWKIWEPVQPTPDKPIVSAMSVGDFSAAHMLSRTDKRVGSLYRTVRD